MKTNQFLLRSVFVAGLGLAVSSSSLFSNGAPTEKTGSPGDGGTTCNECHNNAPAITDQTLVIEVIGMDSTVIAGQTYEIKVTASGTGHTRIGFESTVESDMDDMKIGTFAVEGTNMQIKNNFYATHIGTGTSTTNGMTSWSYQWTAPANFTGSATIYAAGLFSNNSGDKHGDITLTSSQSITVSENLDLTELSEELNLTIFPNPTSEKVHINFELTENADVKIQIFDLNGRYAKVIANKAMEAGAHTISSNLDLPAGNYLISVQKGGEKLVNKLIIQ